MPENTVYLGVGGGSKIEKYWLCASSTCDLYKNFGFGYEDFQAPSLNFSELYWNKQYTFRWIVPNKDRL